jgi:type II secretory pathway pseudopilin PulG
MVRALWFPRSSVGIHTGADCRYETYVGTEAPVCIPIYALQGARERGNEEWSRQRRNAGTRAVAGFTLLEMVLVLFLMALVASAGLMLTDGIEDQAKYEETKRRMEMIRKAIVGDPTRTVNGSPEISGFVADMGRLPGCLAELLELGKEIPDTDPREYQSPCDDSVTITEWDVDDDTGWRGPYIQVLPERNGALRFRDGYGNTGNSADDFPGSNPDADGIAEDERNSGWTWQLVNNEEDKPVGIRLQSFGLDGTQKYPAGEMVSENDEDKPRQLITEYDWRVHLPYKVNVVFKNQISDDVPGEGVTKDVVLLIYGNDFSSPLAKSDRVELQSKEIPSNSFINKDFTFTSPSGPIAIGSRPYVVACNEWDHDNDPETPVKYTTFLGGGGSEGCSTQSISKDDARMFSVVPRQALHLNLDWIIEIE